MSDATCFLNAEGLGVTAVANTVAGAPIAAWLPCDRPWFAAVDAGSRAGAEQAHRLSLVGQPEELECRLPVGAGGERIAVRIRVAAAPGPAGRPDWVVLQVTIPTLRPELDAVVCAPCQAELESLYRTAPIGLGLLDEQLRYVRINDYLADFNGLPVEEHLGRPFDEVVPDLAELVRPLLTGLLASGEPMLAVPIEGHNPRRSGQKEHCLASFVPIRDREGRGRYLSLAVLRTTDQVAQDRRRQAAEDRYRQIVETVNQGICVLDNDRRIVMVNRRMAEMVGYSVEELIGMTPMDLGAPERQSEIAEDVASREQGIQPTRDFQLRRKDGSRLDVIISSTVLHDAEGRPEALLGSLTDITERAEMTARLRESEERFRLLAELIPQLVFTVSADGRLEHLNGRWLEYTGKTIEQAISEPYGEVHPDDLAETQRRWDAALVTGTEYQVEQRILSAEGQYRWFLVRARPLLDASGVVVRWYGTCTDIDESRQRAQEALDREERLRLALEAGQIQAWDYHWSSRRLIVPEPMRQLAGLTGAGPPVTVRGLLRRLDPGDRRRFLQAVRTSLASRQPHESELRLVRPDGGAVDLSVWWSVQHDAQGRPERILGVLRDVTARRQVEREKLAAEVRFRHMLETAMEGVWVVDASARTTLVNAAMARILGYAPEAMIGRSLAEFMDDAAQREAAALFERRRSGVGEVHEFRFRHRDGSDVWAIVSTSPIFDEAGEFQGSFGLITDITARKRLEAELLRAREAAEGASRTKSQFLANMSHELRTPVAAMLGFSDMIAEPGLPESEKENVLESIRRSGEHLLKLIDNVLDISRIESGRPDVAPIDYSPRMLLDDVIHVTTLRSESSGVPLQARVHGRLPELCRIDPTRVRQVLVNLVNNAIKFSRPGAPVLLDLRAEPAGAGVQLVFDVVDQGIGIAAEDLQRLFQPFTQVDSSMSRKYGGSGLGLSIAAGLVEAMGGTIAVQSQPGSGSRFTVTIPTRVVNGPRPAAPARLAAGTEAVAPGPVRRGRVLVVEDHHELQLILGFYLERAGLEVDFAADGQVAVEKAQQRRYDLILMDIQMAVMDGYEATRVIRAQGFDGPILALTAHAVTGDRERCLAAGCTGYLSKPIDRRSLLEAIERYLPTPVSR